MNLTLVSKLSLLFKKKLRMIRVLSLPYYLQYFETVFLRPSQHWLSEISFNKFLISSSVSLLDNNIHDLHDVNEF